MAFLNILELMNLRAFKHMHFSHARDYLVQTATCLATLLLTQGSLFFVEVFKFYFNDKKILHSITV